MLNSLKPEIPWAGSRQWMQPNQFLDLIQQGDEQVQQLLQKIPADDVERLYLAYHTSPEIADQLLADRQFIPKHIQERLAAAQHEYHNRKLQSVGAPALNSPEQQALKTVANPVELAAQATVAPVRLGIAGAMGVLPTAARAVAGALGNTITGVVSDPMVDEAYDQSVWRGLLADFIAGVTGGLTVENALHSVASKFGTPAAARLTSSLMDTGSNISEAVRQAAADAASKRQVMLSHMERLDEYASAAAEANKSIKKYLMEDMGLAKKVAAEVAKLASAKQNLKLPSIEEAAQQALAQADKRDWYRQTISGLHLIAKHLNRDEFRQFVTLLAWTSRKSAPHTNMTTALKAWWDRKIQKAGIPISDDEKDYIVAAFKHSDDVWNIAFDEGIRKGHQKLHDFADTLYTAALEPEKLKDMVRPVIDARMGQWAKWNPVYWVQHKNTDGSYNLEQLRLHDVPYDSATPTAYEVELIRDHIVKVRDYLRQVTGQQWDTDQVQAALWYYLKQARVEAGLDPASTVPTTYYGALQYNAEKHFGLPKGTLTSSDRDKSDKFVEAMIKQKVRTSGDVMPVDHYSFSSTRGRTYHDPAFQGTGFAGEEKDRVLRGEGVPKVQYYRAGATPEAELRMKPMYRTVLRGKYYDKTLDPEGIFNRNAGKAGAIEEELAARGYDGWFDQYTVASFLPNPTMPMRSAVLSVSPAASETNINRLEEYARRVGDEEALEHVDKLRTWQYHIANGKVDTVMRDLKDEILHTLDHPTIDVNEIRYTIGRWLSAEEPSFTIIARAGDEDILRAKFAQLLKQNAQSAGLFRAFVRPDEVPQTLKGEFTPSVFARLTKVPDVETRHKIWSLLNEVDLPGSTFNDKLGIIDIATLPDDDVVEFVQKLRRFDALLNEANLGVRVGRYDWGIFRTDLIWEPWGDINGKYIPEEVGKVYNQIIDRGISKAIKIGVPWEGWGLGGNERHLGRVYGELPYYINPLFPSQRQDRTGAGLIKSGFPVIAQPGKGLEEAAFALKREGYMPIYAKEKAKKPAQQKLHAVFGAEVYE